jgi:ATP-dependent Clp protease adaptor protein ClpS
MPLLLHDPRLVVYTLGLPAKQTPGRLVSYNKPSAGALETPLEDLDVLTATEDPFSLIVWNDEVNTFEWVIETLMEVCGQSLEQAEQCAMIIHTKGSYAVKRGSYDELKPLCDAITERGIGATIEILSQS